MYLVGPTITWATRSSVPPAAWQLLMLQHEPTGLLFIFFCCSNKTEDIEEEVDNVKVDGDGSEDVLLGGDGVLVVAPHHHLEDNKISQYTAILKV